MPSYNWLSFFTPQFKKVTRIKQYHQFQITSTHPGVVVCKDYSDSPGTPITILKQPWTPKSTKLPPIITPSGLSPEREWYLFDKIRPFCERRYQDITCPMPSVPRPRTPCTTPTLSPVHLLLIHLLLPSEYAYALNLVEMGVHVNNSLCHRFVFIPLLSMVLL